MDRFIKALYIRWEKMEQNSFNGIIIQMLDSTIKEKINQILYK